LFGEELLELNPEQESLQDERHNNCHDNHGEDVEYHKERSAIVDLEKIEKNTI
jgi:hypothetical protein